MIMYVPPMLRPALIAVISAGLGLAAYADEVAPKLWFLQPAAKWTDGLPLGNGRVGAMVMGGFNDERIQYNEDTLWSGHPHDYAREDAGQYLAPIREAIAAGRVDEAGKLAKEHFLGDPTRQKAYQPFGDLRIRFIYRDLPDEKKSDSEPSAPSDTRQLQPSIFSDYRRELNLDTATASISFRRGNVIYRREVFVSHPDRVLVVRLSADHPGQLSFTAVTDSHGHRRSTMKALGADTLALVGEIEPEGLRFESRLLVRSEGGTTRVDDRGVVVDRANRVTLILAAATSFKTWQDINGDPAAICAGILEAVHARSFEMIQQAHIADHQRLFRRVAITLGADATTEAIPTDRRLARVKTTGLAADPALAALYFQYGRYLLIASSRPGGQPANLQGIWNDEPSPPWESKWTTNINLEMNYWPAEVTNLSECAAPLFDLIDDLAVSGQRTALVHYRATGWVVHHNTDLWRGTAPINNIDGVWPTGGAWLCQHLWEHYLFTGDREFLKTRAYPVMKSAAQFFLDTLVKDAKTGWLVTSPSYSPEQGALTAGPAMDNQILRALFAHTRAAAVLLGIDRDFATKVADAEAQLPPNLIGRYGQLQEWLADVDQPNNAHRHMSPLWALYPGADITPADPKTYAAAKVLLTWRGEGGTGWSYAWRIPLWARVGDGDYAFQQLSQLFGRKTLPNLLDLCGPFQIDGNFGATAGIAELLLQSHTRTAPGDLEGVPVIDLLPALPKALPDGAIHGLRARGDFEVDLAWHAGALSSGQLRGKPGATCRVRYGNRVADVTIPPSGAVDLLQVLPST